MPQKRTNRTVGALVGVVLFAMMGFLGTSGEVGATTFGQAQSQVRAHQTLAGVTSSSSLRAHAVGSHTVVVAVNCTFNGVASNGVLGGTLTDVTPGEAVEIACFGTFTPNTAVCAAEESPLVLTSVNPPAETDEGAIQCGFADSAGSLDGVFTMPDPFVATDPNAVCPPPASQASLGDCILAITDGTNLAAVNVEYGHSATSPTSSGPPVTDVTGMASTPNGGGYWLTDTYGDVSPHGNAVSYGSLTGQHLNAPISHIVSTPDGLGYWLVAADGGTFAFGDAKFFGSMGGRHLNAPVVDLAPTPDGKGYWLVASDGGIFAFGDAHFHGSMGGQHLNKPIMEVSADNAAGGYWLVASDGGIFAFGAPFFGSTGAIHLNKPVIGMTVTVSDKGYLFVASDGGIFAFGDAKFFGSTGATPLNAPIVGMATDPVTGGYWLVASDGGVFAYHAPFFGAG